MKTRSIRKAVDSSNLHDSLRLVLRWASREEHEELARWCSLELGGYFDSNPAMGEDIEVPSYRSVAGQHSDLYGRPLVLETKLSFINETRLRNGVEELAHLASKKDDVSIHDPSMCEMIREHLEVEVYTFTFSATHLVGILSAIRMELDRRLDEFAPEVLVLPGTDDVFLLKPNFHGIGIDLRALWRRLFGTG